MWSFHVIVREIGPRIPLELELRERECRQGLSGSEKEFAKNMDNWK